MSDALPHHRSIDTDELRTRRIAQLRQRHWSVLLISIAVMALAFCLDVQGVGRVAVARFPNFPVPELCSSRAWFGVSCPGCGLTRSFVHLAHGRFTESIAAHRVGWILALVVVLQLPYRILALRQSPVGGLNRRWPNWLGTALIVMLIGNWLAQLLPL